MPGMCGTSRRSPWSARVLRTCVPHGYVCDSYRRFCKRRAVAEHTIARLKDHQILRQCRRRGKAIDHAIAGVAALHNLKLETA